MTCTSCGAANEAGSRFCDECGLPIASGCPACGAENRPGARFCGTCGARLFLPDPVGHLRAPESGGPPDGPDAASVQAERRLVSVLFADLVGFTPFAEETDPEEVRDFLSRWFDVARTAIERHGGTVEKFIGDAVMAVWGAPVAREDDAARCVRAALELVDAVRGMGLGHEARAGVLSGSASVDLAARGEGMVAGDMVNTAARLQSVARPGTVLVGEATVRATEHTIAYEPAGDHALKGKAAPVAAWRALRVMAARAAGTDALEAPFVGRADELRLLKDLLHSTARDRRARIIAITGPAGIGKSRLASEFQSYVDGLVEDVWWHRGRSPSYGEGITFWALGEMVRMRARLAEDEDETTTRQRIAAVVAEFVPDEADRGWVEPALLALLGAETQPGGREALFAAWRIFFERIAERGPAVLLFEDLHWADSGTLDFIDHLLDWSKGVPILVVALSRPELFERRPEWAAGRRNLTALALEPLNESAMRDLLAGLVPGLPEGTAEAILARADGVPLYAVETVRMLVADGRLKRVDGVYRPADDLGSLAVPETLRSLIAARLDALDPRDRRLISDASVLGQTFAADGLAAVSGYPVAELEERLKGLVRRELLDIEADPTSPERGRYRFVQSLIREVAYSTLGRKERRERHLAVARHFEAIGDDELASLLAGHYVAAHDASEGPEAAALAAQARLALRGAASRAMSLGANGQAATFARQAATFATEALDRAELLELGALAADLAADYDLASDLAGQAVATFTEAGDRLAAGRATAALGAILLDRGEIAQSIDQLNQAIETMADDEPETRARLEAILSRAYMRSGADVPSIAAAERALAVAEVLNLDEVVAEALVNKGTSLGNAGRRRESVALLEAAIRMASVAGWISIQLRATNNLAATVFDDEPSRATTIARDGMEFARRVGDRGHFHFLAGTYAYGCAFDARDWDNGRAALHEALESTTSDFERLRLISVDGAMAAARGEPMTERLEEIDALERRVGDPESTAYRWWLHAEAAMAAGRSEAVVDAAARGHEAMPYIASAAAAAMILATTHLDLGAARTVEQLTSAYTQSGAGVRALKAFSRGLLAWKGGAPIDGANAMGAAISAVRGLDGADWPLAVLELAAMRLAPDDDAATGWADEARAIFERVGAKAYVAMLDEAIVASTPKRSRSGASASHPAARADPIEAPTQEV